MLPCHRKQENLPRASCFGLVSKTAAFGVCGAQHFDARLDLVASVALVHPLCLACDTVLFLCAASDFAVARTRLNRDKIRFW